MPRTAEDVENFLYRLNRTFERADSLFIVSSGVDRPPIVLSVGDPILVARVDIGAVPADQGKQNALFRKMLEFNATDLVHASYGLEGEEIVLTAGLPLENLDDNELAAVMSDIDIALARHVPELRGIAS
jgi:CesT_Tir_1